MRSLLFLPLLFGLSGPAIADSEVFKIDVSAGKYYYVFSPHASFGMGGLIIVE